MDIIVVEFLLLEILVWFVVYVRGGVVLGDVLGLGYAVCWVLHGWGQLVVHSRVGHVDGVYHRGWLLGWIVVTISPIRPLPTHFLLISMTSIRLKQSLRMCQISASKDNLLIKQQSNLNTLITQKISSFVQFSLSSKCRF